jgi:DNA polymerase III delta subunit
MKIANNQIENFISNQLSELDAAIFYGPDAGQSKERIEKIKQTILGKDYDPMLYNRFEAGSTSYQELDSEINNFCLIPGRKFILIDNAGNQFLPIKQTNKQYLG